MAPNHVRHRTVTLNPLPRLPGALGERGYARADLGVALRADDGEAPAVAAVEDMDLIPAERADSDSVGDSAKDAVGRRLAEHVSVEPRLELTDILGVNRPAVVGVEVRQIQWVADASVEREFQLANIGRINDPVTVHVSEEAV